MKLIHLWVITAHYLKKQYMILTFHLLYLIVTGGKYLEVMDILVLVYM